MIRLLLLGFLFYIGYAFFRFLARVLLGNRAAPPPARSRDGEEMVRDSQCGTFIPRGDALSALIDGKRHYFCSEACREAFRSKN